MSVVGEGSKAAQVKESRGMLSDYILVVHLMATSY
jgi:hypothetical protein